MEEVIYLLLIPLAAAVIAPVSEKVGRWTTIGLSLATALLAGYMLVGGYRESSGWFYVDWYSLIVVNMISWVYFFASAASVHYVERLEKPFYRPALYWSFLSLFALTMLFAAVVRNLGWVWIGLEGTTIVSALLILTDGEKRNVEGAWRYMIVASTGLGIAFLSIVLAYAVSGTLDFTRMSLTGKAAETVSLLALIGFGTKVGLFPMHSWLPDAHGSAPSPVSAMLSGTLLPTALLAYTRIFHVAARGGERVVYITLTFGLATLIIAAVLMASQRFIKRLLAYSSMDMMGVATVGVALSYYHPQLLKLVFILLAVHAFAKGALFISAGSLINAYGSHEVDEMEGVLRSTGLTGYTFGLSALAVTGAPPFGTFLAELMALGVALSISRWWAFFIGTGLLLSFLALNWQAARVLFGERVDISIPITEELVPFTMLMTALGLSVYVWYTVVTGGMVL